MAKRTHKLTVGMNNKKVGELSQSSSGGLYFQYSAEWINEQANFPISLRMPVREEIYSGDCVQFYFDNLLPDIKAIRDKLASLAKAKSSNTFDLIAAIGRDCIGALQFFNADEDIPEELARPSGKELNAASIAKVLKNLKTNPLGLSEDSDFRISLTGAQEKTALLKLNGKWHQPLKSTPTTHIFKPAIGIVQGEIDFTSSVENEWLCLNICKKFGLPTTNAEIKRFNKIPVLVVERFDRLIKKGKIYRLPQEDLCQALGFPSTKKYQTDGGPGIQSICELLKSANDSFLDRRNFIKTQIIFWLLAAIDGHAKNFSIQLLPGGFQLSPLYDILSAEPAIQNKQLNKFKAKMSMKVGIPGHYKIQDIQGRHWLQMEKTLGLPKGWVSEIAAEVIQQLPQVISSFKKLPSQFPNKLF